MYKTKKEWLREVPHNDLIKKHGRIEIPSIFMFGCYMELFPFLHACREMDCVVRFANEGLTIRPKGEPIPDMLISLYTSVMEQPKIATDYIRYINNLDEMVWPSN